ncbi:uncharacterized protein [Battus philenor]|uniref:uncharacterized protein n=1 Tax=Battus philenor TaxID=42288 RepID=UPI0035D008C7
MTFARRCEESLPHGVSVYGFVKAKVWNNQLWSAGIVFTEKVMSQKEAAEREIEGTSEFPICSRRPGRRRELSRAFLQPPYEVGEADLDMISESMTAPPIVHVVTSRSTVKVNPGRDSVIMTVSNSVYYVFRGLLGYRLKIHCEHMVKSPIIMSKFNTNSFLYLWPIYFSAFYFGNVYTLMYFCLRFLMEFFTLTITMQCLIETIVYEWKWAKRTVVTVGLCLLGILFHLITDFRIRILLYVYSVSVVTTFEVLIIYCLYPLGRLVDDITFHRGVSPTTFRVVILRIVPIFYCVSNVLV